MAVRLLPAPRFSMEKGDGTPASGWKIYTYQPGTSTAKNTYTTSVGDVANANPVVLNARGEADIWWDGLYKVVVKDENDVTIYTVDNYGTGSDPISTIQFSLVKNYSFESATVVATSPDNWTVTLYGTGTSTLDTASGGQIHGAKGLKFISLGAGGGYAESEFFEVEEAVVVPVIFAIKSTVADVRNVVEIMWYDRAQSLLSTASVYDNSTTNPTSWTDQLTTVTPPSNARFAKVRLTGCHSSDATAGSSWFDNVRVGFGTLATQSANAVAITGGSVAGITDLAVADGGTGASTAAGARTNLGLDTMATQAANAVAITGGSVAGITDLAVADGGTGASTAATARSNLATNDAGNLSTGTVPSPVVVPLGRMQRTEVTGENSSGPNWAGALAYGSVLDVGGNLGTVNVGDRILLHAYIRANDDSGSAQLLYFGLAQTAGTATTQFGNDLVGTTPGWRQDFYCAGNADVYATLSAIMKVTGTGTLTVNVLHGADGSGNIGVGNAQFHAIVLNNG